MNARSQASGRKRILWLGCCGLVAVACGLLIALAWGFSASGRHRILETVEARAASASGLDIRIGDFHTDLLAAAVELQDVSIATPGKASFLEVASLRLDFAYPLDRRDEIDAKYKIYFGFGDVF